MDHVTTAMSIFYIQSLITATDQLSVLFSVVGRHFLVAHGSGQQSRGVDTQRALCFTSPAKQPFSQTLLHREHSANTGEQRTGTAYQKQVLILLTGVTCRKPFYKCLCDDYSNYLFPYFLQNNHHFLFNLHGKNILKRITLSS